MASTEGEPARAVRSCFTASIGSDPVPASLAFKESLRRVLEGFDAADLYSARART
jgi:hypothetical protein